MSKQESVTNAVDKAMDIEQVVADAIQYAKRRGADHVEISARNDKGYSISARLGDI